MRSIATLICAVGLLATACGSADRGLAESNTGSDDTSSGEETPDGNASDGDTSATSETDDETSDVGTSSDDTASPDDSASPDDTTSSGDDSDPDIVVDPSAYRLAPAGSLPLELLHWTADDARKQGHTGEWGSLADGPFFEVAEVPFKGLAIQRERAAEIIWLIDGTGDPKELLVATTGQRLELEGAAENQAGDPVVFYQRHILGGSPETTRSTLREYNLNTQEVREIVVTGGWESGTSFSQLGGGAVVGTWSGEGWVGVSQVDLVAGVEVYDGDAAGHSCFDGEPGCPAYDQATMLDGQIYGIRSGWNEELGFVDTFGVHRFDPTTGTDELLAEFDWDNGLWYAEDMFALGSELVISLKDGNDEPLPALMLNPSTGEMWTLPEASFVRRAYLS